MLRSSDNASELDSFTRTIDTPARVEKGFVAFLQIGGTSDIEVCCCDFMSVQLNESEIIAFLNGDHKRREVFCLLRDICEFNESCPVGCTAEQCLVVIANEFDARTWYGFTGR